jgi:hypothetical protein
MKIEDIKKFIEEQKDGKKYLDALNVHLESLATATKADKDEIKKLKDEAKENKTKIEAINAKVEKFADALGVSEDSETLDDDIAAALKTKGDKADPALQRKIDRLTKQLNDTQKNLTDQLTAERGKRHESMIKNALLSELTAQNAVDPATLVDMFRSGIQVAEDDTMSFTADGKSIKDGVAAWLQAHPVFVANNQKQGAGGAGGGGSDTGNKFVDLAKSLGKSAAGDKEDPSATYFK